MRFVKEVINIGTSRGIILDKVICDTANLKTGDMIVIDIVRKIRRKKESGKKENIND